MKNPHKNALGVASNKRNHLSHLDSFIFVGREKEGFSKVEKTADFFFWLEKFDFHGFFFWRQKKKKKKKKRWAAGDNTSHYFF